MVSPASPGLWCPSITPDIHLPGSRAHSILLGKGVSDAQAGLGKEGGSNYGEQLWGRCFPLALVQRDCGSLVGCQNLSKQLQKHTGV